MNHSTSDDAHRILIVEGDVLIRHPLAEYLRECGYKVAEALDAAEAIKLLGHEALPIDIVLSRGEGGLEIAAWVRANDPDIEVFLTGSVERETEKAGELCEDGAAGTMPYEHKFVLERIRQLMGARSKKK